MTAILPGSAIGILGGGQLGRMLALEAHRMGYRVGVLDPAPDCPASQVSDWSLSAPFDDIEAVSALAEKVDVVTFETELIPAEVLAHIEPLKLVHPSSTVLRTIQDRLLQKDFLSSHEIPQARYASVTDHGSLENAARVISFPAILKSRRAGYDGKGQVRVEEARDLAGAWAQLNHVPAVLETVIPFQLEISVILARSVTGEVCVYPVAENSHRRHILHTTCAPARIVAVAQQRAVDLAVSLAHALDHCGVLAVEMFLLKDNTLFVNEIAPRTHNSGHFTFGACATSQFEQHARAICGLPLGDPALLHPAVMVNLLGDLWQTGVPQWEAAFAHPQVRLHLYGKKDAKVGRKMGHLLLLDNDTDRALQLAEKLLVDLSASA